MTTTLHTHKLTITFCFLILAQLLSAQTAPAFDNALAYAGDGSDKPAVSKSAVSDIARYTSINDISANNYFQLAGASIHPYMMVENATRNYEPVMVGKNEEVSLEFGTDNITYSANGKTYHFNIVNIDQYLNTSDKCLIRSKIDVQCDAVKIGKEKVESIEIYVDQNNHISFIAIGDSELYLRP